MPATRQQLADTIACIEDEATLQALLDYARALLTAEDEADPNWDNISPEELKIIEAKIAAGEADIAAGRVHSNEDVMTDLRRKVAQNVHH